MRKFVKLKWVFVVLLIILYLPCATMADDKATKEECIAKAKQAAQAIKTEGAEATFQQISDPNGPFVWKDSFVFCVDNQEAKFLAHPYLPPTIIGRSMIDWADRDGKLFMREILEVANTKGEGWVSYAVRKPGTREFAQKTSYIYKVPDENLIVGAGIFMDE